MTKTTNKRHYIFLLRCLLTLFGTSIPFVGYSQQDSLSVQNPVNMATSFSIGNSSLYDTYLSPLKYEGTSLRLTHERLSRKPLFKNRFVKQQIFDLEIASTDNPAKTASEYWFLLDYRLGGHYELIRQNNFKLRIGGIWNISGGVLYNERNGNNPASARAYSNLNLSAMTLYNWKIFTFRWQMDTPFMGILFSPKYGQSYYEISLGNSAKVVNFASLHNQRALRNYITIDIPVWKFTLRAGYLGSYYQTKVHDIHTHTYSNSFVLGFVTEAFNISSAKSRKNPNWNSCYY